MRRGMLIIDRGSREPEASEELDAICAGVMGSGDRYEFAEHCFLEVVPPFIAEGMGRALGRSPDALTIVPYFLYPGRKVKAAVADAVGRQAGTGVRFVVSRPMSMHRSLVRLVDRRVRSALEEAGLGSVPSSGVDVLVVGHGSRDPNAARSIRYIVDGLAPSYRNAAHCFLEMEQPDIRRGVEEAAARGPAVLAVVLYFLHEGAHVKRDVREDLDPALRDAGLGRVVVTRHIGADPAMVGLVVEKAREAEDAAGCG